MSLLDVIKRIRSGNYDSNAWLFTAGLGKDLSLGTDAELGIVEFDEDKDEEIYPPGFEQRGLKIMIDVETVDASIKWADRLSGGADDNAAAEVIRYYIRFDAWPEELGQGDPPPPEEAMRLSDRKFYDDLGEERPDQPCKVEGCTRGSVNYSVRCRTHHFEMVKNKPCPFDD